MGEEDNTNGKIKNEIREKKLFTQNLAKSGLLCSSNTC